VTTPREFVVVHECVFSRRQEKQPVPLEAKMSSLSGALLPMAFLDDLRVGVSGCNSRL